jgi:hypothetical protein
VNEFDLESGISEWKAYLSGKDAIKDSDTRELEDHLRMQVDGLIDAGLDSDEAFLIAVKRIGNLDVVSREYAVVHSGRLWKNLVFSAHTDKRDTTVGLREFGVVLILALCAATTFKLPFLAGIDFEDENIPFFMRNFSLFCLPYLALYFIWKRQLEMSGLQLLAAAAFAGVLFANVYPFSPQGSTEILTVLHLPLALWFLIGVVYTGDWWRSGSRRMDFVRFSGEFAIYYVLIALGGGVMTGFTVGMFSIIGLDIGWLAATWIIPCGAAGAVLVASWLVEAKQGAIENMAPVLTRVFTPLFTLSLLSFLITMLVTGNGIDVQREVLIGFDLALVLVLGLVLYAVSSRDPDTAPGWFDILQLILVLSALLVDLLALAAIAGRISELGFTPNRVAALGENIILLVSLSGSAWYYFRFIRGESGFSSLEKWQTDYIPVYVLWAVIVVVVFPPLFGFI